MGAGFSNYVVTKLGALVRTAIQSPGFVAGSTGWQIRKNGSAEFNDVTIRGAAIQDAEGLWYYPAPGENTLVASVSADGGTDVYGNVYLAGEVTYAASGGTYYGTQTLTGGVASLTGGAGVVVWSAPTMVGDSWGIFAWMVLDIAGGVWIAGGAPLAANDPSVNGIKAEAWHDMTLASGWSAVAGYPTPAFRLNAVGNVETVGRVTTTGTANNIASLPVGYYSTVSLLSATALISSSGVKAGQTPRLFLGTNGALDLDGVDLVSGTATTLNLDGTFMLSAA